MTRLASPPPARRWTRLGGLLLLLAAAPSPAAEKKSVLAEMQKRGILPAERQAWSDDEWTMLWKIKKAEGEGAVDTLIAKDRRIKSLVAVRTDPAGRKTFLLTPAGYERYFFFKSQDSIRAFESRGIALKEVFHLTSLAGHPFFDGAGLLTGEGEAAYDAIRRGEAPQWKFDWEPIPESALAQEKRRDPPEVLALRQAGMKEISDEEESWLIRTTGCSELRLQETASLAVVSDPYRNKRRYFLNPGDPVYALVGRYRAGDREPQGIGGTLTFGKGRGGICD